MTHNTGEVARLSDVAAVMYLGELIVFGATARMLIDPLDHGTRDYLHGSFG